MKLLISWDFEAQQPLEFTQNGAKEGNTQRKTERQFVCEERRMTLFYLDTLAALATISTTTTTVQLIKQTKKHISPAFI